MQTVFAFQNSRGFIEWFQIEKNHNYEKVSFLSEWNRAVSVFRKRLPISSLVMLILLGVVNQAYAQRGDRALHFGVNGYVNCGTDNSIQIAGTAITIEAWIYPTQFDGSADDFWQNTIVDKSDNNDNDNTATGFVLRCGGNGRLDFGFGSGPTPWHHHTSPTGTLVLNQWQYVTATYDGSNVKLYVNGVLKHTQAQSSAIRADYRTRELRIGEGQTFTGRPFNGLINGVRIWSVARTQQQIIDNMNAEVTQDESLRADYRIAGASNTITDYSQYTNTGTFSASGVSWKEFYPVTYNGNDASVGTAPDPETKIEGVNLTLATNSGNLSKTGYAFDGWNTQADGNGVDYTAGTTYTANAALTLYAKWTLVCTNPTNGGTIGTAQTICSGATPAELTQTAAPGGSPVGTLEYQWQSSTTSAEAGFSNILSATSSTYQPGTLSQTTWFKRLVKVDCESVWVESNVVQITVKTLQQFRTRGSLDWTNPRSWTTATNWEQYTGIEDVWITANEFPGQNPNSCSNPLVTIQTGHQMEIQSESNINIPNLKIEGTGKLTIQSGGKIYVQDQLQLDENAGGAIVVE
jgi:uncharacterized repeat protein (TIGR02543 family)